MSNEIAEGLTWPQKKGLIDVGRRGGLAISAMRKRVRGSLLVKGLIRETGDWLELTKLGKETYEEVERK